jgi:hypothetical protein
LRLCPDSCADISASVNGGRHLFSTSIPGGDTNLISADVAKGNRRGVSEFIVSSDNQKALYLSDQYSSNVFELYITPLEGQKWGRVSGDFVVYVADQKIDNQFELFMAPTNVVLGENREAFCFPVISKNKTTSMVCLSLFGRELFVEYFDQLSTRIAVDHRNHSYALLYQSKHER